MNISGHVISHLGVKKFANEDNYLMNDAMNDTSKPISEAAWQQDLKENYLYYAGVLDGMGGGECGQLASFLAARMLRQSFNKVAIPVTEEVIDKIAHQGFMNANCRIVEEQKKRSILGTTATVVCIQENRARVYHLGDSRAYLFRDGKLTQLTKDQTLAKLKIDAGIYGPEDPQAKKDKNMLTEYLGADATMTSIRPLQSKWISLQPSDKLLLCSDGLYHICSDEEIGAILQLKAEPKELTERLVCKALEKGGTDNITCMVIKVGDI